SDTKTLLYKVQWLPPLDPNGLIYFYTLHILHGDSKSKDERCLEANRTSYTLELLPQTKYEIRLITETITLLNRQYQGQGNETQQIAPYVSLIITTQALPSIQMMKQLIRNKPLLIGLILGSIFIFVLIILAISMYYKYTKIDENSFISKNPNYELYVPDKWEIEKDAVVLQKQIGQGHFGMVYQGELRLANGQIKKCAVKVN
ncbi:unnamed protein product, partial [Didymodactylos carnosus]